MKELVNEPEISVGILSAREISIVLHADYSFAGSTFNGPQTFTLTNNGEILWNNRTCRSIDLLKNTSEDYFEVADVVIGVNFHWERCENQLFKGNLSIIVEGDRLTLINRLPLEEYLMSVISSEMSATASPEFLKSHAVISRSWLLAQIYKRKQISGSENEYSTAAITDSEIIRWYDREDHANFDVCADDHCQRYQGITRQTTPVVREAVESTRGLVLLDEDSNLCDARFSKCCGGVFEQFENCWEPVHHHYLEATGDYANESDFPDLTIEENARQWILGRPDAYCNTTDNGILSQVLNNYDQETKDFYRWQVTYTQDELSQLIKQRSGIDFGGIVGLTPVERGTSGRIVRLQIIGTKKTMIIGKELEIRKTLSTSHLYSSAFIVEVSEPDEFGLPRSFTLHGAGWGHGVGLCQIGAAVMGANGSSYRQILEHYFSGATFCTLY